LISLADSRPQSHSRRFDWRELRKGRRDERRCLLSRACRVANFDAFSMPRRDEMPIAAELELGAISAAFNA